ncbi:MAG: ArsC family transcriptional regulator [Spirochaetes bacterium]|nr:ArsC family transcriptional regulator [Spirochaetota bacterium]
MTLQIFGRVKCRDTQKAMRFFKERGIYYQFIDLNEKKISKGELNCILKYIKADDLIDKECREFKDRGFAYMTFDPEELILENPAVIKTPVVRSVDRAYNGSEAEEWKKFL